MSVYAEFAGNTFTGLTALALYADNNGNGLVDAPDELVSGVEDGIFRAKTGRETGSIRLLLRINLSCAFRARVYAFSGPVSGVMEINVTAIGRAPGKGCARFETAGFYSQTYGWPTGLGHASKVLLTLRNLL